MISNLLFRMRALFRRSAMEEELDEELQAHLEHQVEKHIFQGLTPEEAQRRARFDFGDLEQVKDECRRSWGVQLADELAAGIRLGLRQILHSPVLSAVSVLALVLGLVANTMMFEGLTAVMHRLSPQQAPASPVLTARSSVPPPLRPHDVRSAVVARKVHNRRPHRTRSIHRSDESNRARLRPQACERVTTVTAGLFRAPGAGGIPATAWTVREAENGGTLLVLISETWRQTRLVASGEALEMISYRHNASLTIVEFVAGNPGNPQVEGWGPLNLNAQAAKSNSIEWGALAVMEQSGRCTSVTSSLSNL
jgi:hypothetical protein